MAELYRVPKSDAEENRRIRDYREEESSRGSMDLPFLMLTILLLGIGLIMVLSASFASAYYESGNPTQYFTRQFIFSIAGVACMLAAARLPIGFYRRIAMPLLIASIALLLAVPVIGVDSGGAKRWIWIGFTTFQPSEIAKIAEILAFASMICVYKEKMSTFRYGVLPFGIVTAVIVGLLLLEPHISASIVIIGIAAIMMFAGGTKLKWFGIAAVIIAALGTLVITQFSYASSRISTWLDPFSDTQDTGWQIIQSLYSIGSGGLLGLGLGQSRQKYLYLPEEHNDFIFAVICEELGFIGAMLILALFAMLIIRGYWLALHCRNRFGSLVITGITSLLAMQVFINVGVVTNLLPCTGIALPFFSYGGTALVIQLAEMGIILGISRDISTKKAG